jgi:hypothetical protein
MSAIFFEKKEAISPKITLNNSFKIRLLRGIKEKVGMGGNQNRGMTRLK